MPTSEIHVKGSTDQLVCAGVSYRCAVGRAGVVDANEKVEGDGATPAGCWPLRKVYYRPDRHEVPQTTLPLQALTEQDAWCDDPEDPLYNRLVQLPYAGSNESLWRGDPLYGVIVEIGYNDDPPIPGKGSAIFMHVARPGYTPTDGCIALALPDLLDVLKQIGPDTNIIIQK